jgi:hypothetical protein
MTFESHDKGGSTTATQKQLLSIQEEYQAKMKAAEAAKAKK